MDTGCLSVSVRSPEKYGDESAEPTGVPGRDDREYDEEGR
jgi:hypothetical protein